jgi:hypothetical protein
MWGWASLERLLQDCRYGARMLRKNLGFTVVVVLTLALGIGANTAIYSVMQAALAPLAIPDAGRVVMVWTENAKRDWHQFPASVPDYVDWKASGVFSSLGAMSDGGFNLRLADRTDRINGLKSPPSFSRRSRFSRTSAESSGPKTGSRGSEVAILTDGLWHSRFGRSVRGRVERRAGWRAAHQSSACCRKRSPSSRKRRSTLRCCSPRSHGGKSRRAASSRWWDGFALASARLRAAAYGGFGTSAQYAIHRRCRAQRRPAARGGSFGRG